MQDIAFYKYQGTGNDFIMIDNRAGGFPKEQKIIERLCDRRFGIGADGLILLENDETLDFKMVYFNSDGRESSMCGNGGRCTVAFAKFLGIFDEKCSFTAIDGLHEAETDGENVRLKMTDVQEINTEGGDFVLNTGSPHFVRYTQDLQNFDVFREGRNIRNSEKYKAEGINVNFVEKTGSEIFVRTYERGVENETLSCGTGVTAAALSQMLEGEITNIKIKTLGGKLQVSAEKIGTSFKNIWLSGPAKQVFRGEISL